MKEIEYKVLGVDDLELLVKIRIKDLKMFSNQKITNSTIENIRVFYKEKMLKDECHTLVGYQYLLCKNDIAFCRRKRFCQLNTHFEYRSYIFYMIFLT